MKPDGTTPLESISQNAVTRLYMMKHHLVTKAKRNHLTDVVADVCGLHAQVPQTPYLSLWNRVEGFENAWLDQSLYEHKSLVKTWVMRGTLHLIPSTDLPVYNQALKRMWFEHHGRFMRAPEWPPAEERQRVLYPAIADALAQEPLTRKDLARKVRSQLKNRPLPYDRLFSGWGGILKETAYEGLTVHAQPCGRESRFANLDTWLPDLDLDSVSEEEAQKKLLLRYLRGYGPATQQDFMLWSGLTAVDARRAIEGASPLLTRVTITGSTGSHLLLKEDLRHLASMELAEEAPLRLLPKFDSLLLGHKDRTRIIQEQHRTRVFKPKVGDVSATVLADGRIVGTWRQKKTTSTLTVAFAPFEKLSAEVLRQTEEAAEELSQHLGLANLKVLVTP